MDLDVRAGHREQRAQQSRPRAGNRPEGRHGGEAPQARPAQKPQQKRLGLVIAMLREDDKVGIYARKGLVAGSARRALQSQIAVGSDVDGFQLQRNLQPCAQPAAKLRPARGVGADAVIDVHRAQRKPERGRQPEQDGKEGYRIEAAREAQREVRPRKNLGRKHRRHPSGQFT